MSRVCLYTSTQDSVGPQLHQHKTPFKNKFCFVKHHASWITNVACSSDYVAVVVIWGLRKHVTLFVTFFNLDSCNINYPVFNVTPITDVCPVPIDAFPGSAENHEDFFSIGRSPHRVVPLHQWLENPSSRLVAHLQQPTTKTLDLCSEGHAMRICPFVCAPCFIWILSVVAFYWKCIKCI